MTCPGPVVPNDYYLQGLLDVDNSNFGAGNIIIVDANCNHIYIDPATLFASYVSNTFLALTDTPSTYVGSATYLVRVNAAGTALEFINPSSINLAGDKLVASQAGQTPGYLGSVLTVNTTYLTKTVVGPNVYLTLNPTRLSTFSSTQTFLGLTDTPNSYSGQAGKYPRVNQSETGLEFSTAPGAGYRAMMAMDSDFTKTRNINTADDSFVVNNMNINDYGTGSSGMISTYGGYPAIKILESGYYKITIRGNMELTKGVLAARIFAVTFGPTSEYAINDSKFGSTDASNGHGAFPRDMIVSYSGSTIVYLLANTYVMTGGIISTNVGAIGGGITTGTVTVLSTNVIGGGSDYRGHSLEVSRFSY